MPTLQCSPGCESYQNSLDLVRSVRRLAVVKEALQEKIDTRDEEIATLRKRYSSLRRMALFQNFATALALALGFKFFGWAPLIAVWALILVAWFVRRRA